MFSPLPAKQWDLQKAAHLMNRAGFGGTPDEIKAFCELGFDKAVDSVLHGPDDTAQFPTPGWAAPRNLLALRDSLMLMSEADRKDIQQDIQKSYRNDGAQLITWWLERMRNTTNPSREKMTLFWHGHFATSLQKVKQAYYMWRQNETLRQNAFGNFGQMVKAISRDPAMMIWLDTNQSQKGHPNENFARELMELFTLGIGNYTEEDIQQSARAFTGYRVDPRDESFRYAEFQHDDTPKKFLGHTGPFTGDDIINIILQQPACANFITKKLWTFFAYEDPSPALVAALGDEFRRSNYEIRPLMATIFRSQEFYSTDSVRTQIKSPVQFLIGTSKVLGTNIPRGPVSANALRQLGQLPFVPPNVKGWDGGKSWITTSTLLYRYNMANFAVGNGSLQIQRLKKVAGNKPGAATFPVQNMDVPDLTKIVPPQVRNDPKRLIAYLCFRLYQDPLSPKDTAAFEKYVTDHGTNMDDDHLRELLHLMMSTPQYQLT